MASEDARTVDQVVEDEAGSRLYKAALVQRLVAAAEAVAGEFKYDEDEDFKELSALCSDLVKVCGLVRFR